MRYLKLSALILFCLVLFQGCTKKQVVKPIEEMPEEVAIPEPPIEPKKPSLLLKRIFFDFDKSDIRLDAAEVLKENAEMLKKYPKEKIVIEGHCCEIGTTEYNLALGERRAKSGKNYLIRLGITPDRLSTISYGEERPLDPTDLPRNRRCEFVKP